MAGTNCARSLSSVLAERKWVVSGRAMGESLPFGDGPELG
jgi:hypothetical protein